VSQAAAEEQLDREVAALRETDVPGALAVYTLLGELSLSLARQNGADAAALDEIENALAEYRRGNN